jgi:murein DD-endopeptidase MepM/ murein hydrolase activator NlpD
MDPTLIDRLADIFSYQVDFNRDIADGDRWRLVVERRMLDGKPQSGGEIVAAEYVNAGRSHTAVLYERQGGGRGYYAPDGASIRRMFLKCPLRAARITSAFAPQRFHPILKRSKPHLGIDYGAPTGTPVMAVGDGIVTYAHMHGPSGNMIEIRHSSTYLTAYKHLSAYAKELKVGSHVTSGQIIGYVGATGLATGPHLHFELHEGRKVVDPAQLRTTASAEPLPAREHDRFLASTQPLLTALPAWSSGPVALAHRAGAATRTAE